MGPIQSFDEFLSLLVRRWPLIALVCVVGAVLSVLVALSKPQVYESVAVIQVETPVIGAGDAATTEIARLLQTIEQRLTTRDALLAVMDRHGLFTDAPGMSVEQKLFALRSAVTFQSIASASQQTFGQPTSVSALLITARLGTAEQAARVANDFAQGVLDMSVAQQASRARDSLTFFTAEATRLASQIATLESEVTAYKNANVGALTRGSTTDRAALETDLRRVSQQLLAVQAERAALQAKERLRETDRRRIEDLSVQEGVLNQQLAGLEAQRDALLAQEAQSPEVERQLGAYDRQLQQLQSQYEAATARKAEAETSLRLEEENHSEHFTLLERAIVPEYPAGGGRKKIAMAGALASLIAGLGLAFALDLMHPVLRSAAQMQRELDIRPVIVLPDLKLRPAQPLPLAQRLWQRLRELPLVTRLGL